jgi:hypothetical protein
VLYSLSSSVQSFYSSHQSASHPDWIQSKATLKEEFEAAHLKHNVKIALSPAATDDIVWEIEFLYLKDGHPAIEGVRYHIDGAVEADDMPRRPYITGETQVVRRILKPRQYLDARFADLLNNAMVRVFNFAAIGYPENITVDDALFVAHTLIRASFERMHLVTSDPNLVGPTCDCALVRDGVGFEWLEKGFDVRSMAAQNLSH